MASSASKTKKVTRRKTKTVAVPKSSARNLTSAVAKAKKMGAKKVTAKKPVVKKTTAQKKTTPKKNIWNKKDPYKILESGDAEAVAKKNYGRVPGYGVK